MGRHVSMCSLLRWHYTFGSRRCSMARQKDMRVGVDFKYLTYRVVSLYRRIEVSRIECWHVHVPFRATMPYGKSTSEMNCHQSWNIISCKTNQLRSHARSIICIPMRYASPTVKIKYGIHPAHPPDYPTA